VLTLLAQAHERTGDRTLMGDRLALAMEASGQAPAETLRYAQFLISENRLTTARAAWSDGLRRTPGSVELALALGQVHLGLEEWERAEEIIAHLRAIDTTGRGAANELQNRLLGPGPHRRKHRLPAGADRDRRGRYPRRRAGDRRASARRPRRGRRALSERPDRGRSRQPGAALPARRARRGATGDADAARRQLMALAEEYPQDETPVRALYQLEMQQGDAAAAAAVLQAGLERMPNSLMLNWMRAGELERDRAISRARSPSTSASTRPTATTW
jgi:cellulose synthase operon protein C